MSTQAEDEAHDPQLEEINAEGHWKCTKCGNWNFSTRTVCNMRKCMFPRGGNLGVTIEEAASKKLSRLGSLGEDWICKLCKNVNYKQRTHCNRRTCGAPREEWQCHCGNWNFPQRTHCNMKKCNLPRPAQFVPPNAARYPAPYQNAFTPAPQQLSAFLGNAILEDLDKIDISHLPPAAALQLLQSAQQALLQQQHAQQQQQLQMIQSPMSICSPVGGQFQPPAPPYYHGQQPQAQAPVPPSPSSAAPSSARQKRPLKPGEWICPVCDNINFAERMKCNLRSCGTPKPANVG